MAEDEVYWGIRCPECSGLTAAHLPRRYVPAEDGDAADGVTRTTCLQCDAEIPVRYRVGLGREE